ncbi:Cytochrome P450 [Penicillium brevicompactum]|uniref:Cytochrome P450 n=1 Tax=Penicillium brevicompactum TaxID=5074 RepID=UPI0025405C21|nr:Cytochrome P450 [Penicillium brevicompactum]KAJ5325396.1 Cytochrome P450 [Penicillium brevicompactum]
MMLSSEKLLFSDRDIAICIAHVMLIILSGIWLRQRNTIFICHRQQSPQTSQDPSICREIIAGVIQREQISNVLSPHRSRAIANRRLGVAFGINNSFTQTSSAGAAPFVITARSLINLASSDWLAVSHFAKMITKRWCSIGLPSLGDGLLRPCLQAQDGFASRINLASMVQILTMRVALLVMFDKHDQDSISDLRILNLTQSINRVWIASKDKEDHQLPKFEDDAPLQQALFGVFGTRYDQSKDNPMNLIIPSFETMWRVVLRAVLEFGFIRGNVHPDWREAMVAFAMKTTKDEFERTSSSALCSPGLSSRETNQLSGEDSSTNVNNSPSAKHLVMECLRLCPLPGGFIECTNTILSADIEGCHLRRDIWGEDANTFNPDRWLNLTSLQKEAFMPFGSVPFECPAKPTFGPRMIGLLAGAVLVAFDNRSSSTCWKLECGDGDVLEHLKSRERLSLERTAYENLYLVAKEK